MPSRQFVNRVEIGKVNRKYVLQLFNYESTPISGLKTLKGLNLNNHR